MDTAAHDAVLALTHQIERLVAERQALRDAAADRGRLERNRLELLEAQHRLTDALLRAHAPALV